MGNQNHDGHRKRLTEKFLSTNGIGMPDHELIEILLFFSVPRINTNEQAHELINQFGSLNGVFDADARELGRVHMVGDSSATLIKVVSALISRYCLNSHDPREKYTTFSQVSSYLQGLFVGHATERVYMLLFNNAMRLVKVIPIGDGTVNIATLSPNMVAKEAVAYNCAYVIVAHNHPAGLAIPSQEDVITSYSMRTTFEAVGLTMIDHFLVADGKCVPIIRSVEKGRKNEAIEPQNYQLRASQFELEDDLDYELLENINE